MADFDAESFDTQILKRVDEHFTEIKALMKKWRRLESEGKAARITFRSKKPDRAWRELHGLLVDLDAKLKLIEEGNYRYRKAEERLGRKAKTRPES